MLRVKNSSDETVIVGRIKFLPYEIRAIGNHLAFMLVSRRPDHLSIAGKVAESRRKMGFADRKVHLEDIETK